MQIKLKELRNRKGYSQEQLARTIGMSLGNVQKIEYCKIKSIPLDTLEKLCIALECSVGDIMVYQPSDK